MKTSVFTARSAAYWSRRAWDRKFEAGETVTSGPASDVRRIDPITGKVVENIKSEEEQQARLSRRVRRS